MTMRDHAQTQVQPMPTAVKWVLYAISALLLTLSLSILLGAISSRKLGWSLPVSGVFLLTAVGLLRRLSWARSLVSWLSVLVLILMELAFFDSVGDLHHEGILWEALGSTQPLWALFLFAVFFAILFLIPLAIIGWRKDWFRHSPW
jgi:hypothetical protein